MATWGVPLPRHTPTHPTPGSPQEGWSKHRGFKKARAMLTSEAKARRRFCHAVSSRLLSSSSSPSFQISNGTRPFEKRCFFSKTPSSKWAQDLNKSIFQRKLSVWSLFTNSSPFFPSHDLNTQLSAKRCACWRCLEAHGSGFHPQILEMVPYPIWIHIYGTFTYHRNPNGAPSFEWNFGLALGGWPSKIEVIGALGIYMWLMFMVNVRK